MSQNPHSDQPDPLTNPNYDLFISVPNISSMTTGQATNTLCDHLLPSPAAG